MTTVKRAIAVAIGVTAMTLGIAAPANADPGGDDSCPPAMAFLCHLLPVAPDLDHDIDLTKGPATVNGDTLPQLPSGSEGAVDTASQPPGSP